MKKLFIILLFLVSFNAFAQDCDTTFYHNSKTVMSVICKKNNHKKITVFNSNEGNNILTKNDFTYSFFDEQHNMDRQITIKNNEIYCDYWITIEKDTIYNEFVYEDGFYDNVKKFMAQLKDIKYPAEALRNNIKAKKVMVSFIVDKNGVITNLKPLTNYNYGFEEEAIRVVKSIKTFGVISYKGNPVSLYLRLPINFVIK